MAIRVLFLILCFFIAANVIITGAGLIMNENLYKKYTKQIISLFAGFSILIIIIYVIAAVTGLSEV